VPERKILVFVQTLNRRICVLVMSEYKVTWVTTNLAVGSAPMSYADLDAIRGHGIDAIVNLCGEYCDLHEIESQSGFEVYYLPIPDEHAPDMEEMEKGLIWLDEALYLGKKVLVHCRFGIGRTGTFVTAYLIRKGLGIRVAAKKLKHTHLSPESYSQRKLVRKYSKKSGQLKIREPSLESKNVVDLSTYFAQYEVLVKKFEESIDQANTQGLIARCGRETDCCCYEYFNLPLVEVIYLSNKMNRTLSNELRKDVVQRALKIRKNRRRTDEHSSDTVRADGKEDPGLIEAYAMEKILCPLNFEGKCLVYQYRPIRCRGYGVPNNSIDLKKIENALFEISRYLFFAFCGIFLEDTHFGFSLIDTVSGRFVQKYFYYLLSLEENSQGHAMAKSTTTG